MELHLKPKEGLTIRKPDGSKLAAEGERVPRTSFWLKRLADGDVLTVEEAQADKEDVKPAAKATNKKAEK
ncbi:DUF2635 domain-containing protein [Aeromonas dhakensis]|uniref:DUF2635 domain-containing protein n=1 Tax=Aeromonas TaxID=642 RepID=UPI0005A9CAE3|nr:MULTISPECIES: DUF2635 domain-containing protein [Aeromonas]QJT15000.1 DUF2635 domain-containing protein [Aeromonas sp. 2692-1]